MSDLVFRDRISPAPESVRPQVRPQPQVRRREAPA